MSLTRRAFTLSTLAAPFFAPSLHAASNFKIETMADDFDAPWAIGFTPGGTLVT